MKLSLGTDASGDQGPEKEGDLWMISGGSSTLVSYQIPSNNCTVILSSLLMLLICLVLMAVQY